MGSSDGNDDGGTDELEDVSPHVRLRVDPDMKRRWMQYTDENRMTLTDLIVESVENTISGEWVLAEEQQSESVEVDLSGVEGGVEEILSRLSALENQLDAAAVGPGEASEDALSEGELQDLEHELIDVIPRVRDVEMLGEVSVNTAGLNPKERAQLSGTASDVAAVVDRPEGDVRSALIYSEKNEYSDVESVVEDGVRRWFLRDPTIEDEDVLIMPSDVDEDVEFEPASEFSEYRRNTNDVVFDAEDDGNE